MRTLALVSLASAVLLSPVAAGAAEKPKPKLLPPGTAAFADGSRYAALSRGGKTTIVDSARGTRSTIANPGGCLLGMVGSGVGLWACHADAFGDFHIRDF